jgi:hypothetical protein
MAEIGDNQPPSQIAFVEETAKALSAWMADHPVVQTGEEAGEGKLLHDRAKAALQDLEAERKATGGPFLDRIREINESYKQPKTLLEGVSNELIGRLQAYAKAEERKRQAIAEAARKAAAEAERLAKEAQERQREAVDDASTGIFETDIAKTVAETAATTAAAERAARTAQRAEKDTKVKIGGGFRKALSLRTTESLVVTDACAAVGVVGATTAIQEAILTAAREYRRRFGELPDGVEAIEERGL